MTKETDVLQDDSMNEVNGGIGRPFEKAKRRKTIICPRCGAVIEAYTTGIVEGQGQAQGSSGYQRELWLQHK